MATKEFINPPDMYGATWQFNQAIRVRGGDLLFVSGIVGMAPDGSIVKGDIAAQSEAAFRNLSHVLEEAGGTLADIVKVNVYVGESYADKIEELREIRPGSSPATTRSALLCR